MTHEAPLDRISALAFGDDYRPEDQALLELVSSDADTASEAARLFLAAAASRRAPGVPPQLDAGVASTIDRHERRRGWRGPVTTAAAAVAGLVLGVVVSGTDGATPTDVPDRAIDVRRQQVVPAASERPAVRDDWNNQTYRSGFLRGRNWDIVSSH